MSDPGWVEFSMSVSATKDKNDEAPLDFDIGVYVAGSEDGELEASIHDSEHPMTVDYCGDPVPVEVFVAILGDEAAFQEAAREAVMEACRSVQDTDPGWYYDGTHVCRVIGYVKKSGHACWMMVTSKPAWAAEVVRAGAAGIDLVGCGERLRLVDVSEFWDDAPSLRRIEFEPGPGELKKTGTYYIKPGDPLAYLGVANDEIDAQRKKVEEKR